MLTDENIKLALEACAVRPTAESSHQRNEFVKTQVVHATPPQNHTHPTAAEQRTAASRALYKLVERLGYTPYFVEMSKQDQRRGHQGSKTWRDAKGLNAENRPFNPPADAGFIIIDGDQKIDMNKFLVKQFRPTFLYAFQPEHCAGAGEGYSYTCDKDNRWIYNVDGGGHYPHKVWNWSTDHLICIERDDYGSVDGVATYLVDRQRCGTDHELVCLSPVLKWDRWNCGEGRICAVKSCRWSPSHLWRRYIMSKIPELMPGQHLKHINAVEPVADAKGKIRYFLRLEYRKPELGAVISTGIASLHGCATIPAKTDATIAVRGMISKMALSISSVRTVLPTDMGHIPMDEAATVLVAYHRATNCSGPTPKSLLYTLKDSVHHYDYGVTSYDDDAKTTGEAFMPPLFDSGDRKSVV